MAQPWFDETMFGALYGSIAGGVGGSLAGILGGFIGMWAPKGKHRRFIMGAMLAFILFGLANIGLGLYALLDGQPYGIWYGFLLTGSIFTVVMTCGWPIVRTRYKQAEQRRLQAEGFRGN
jgi:hypothetical protein